MKSLLVRSLPLAAWLLVAAIAGSLIEPALAQRPPGGGGGGGGQPGGGGGGGGQPGGGGGGGRPPGRPPGQPPIPSPGVAGQNSGATTLISPTSTPTVRFAPAQR